MTLAALLAEQLLPMLLACATVIRLRHYIGALLEGERS